MILYKRVRFIVIQNILNYAVLSSAASLGNIIVS